MSPSDKYKPVYIESFSPAPIEIAGQRDGIDVPRIYGEKEIADGSIPYYKMKAAYGIENSLTGTVNTTSTTFVDTGISISFTTYQKLVIDLFGVISGYIASGANSAEQLAQLVLDSTVVDIVYVPGRYFTTGGNHHPSSHFVRGILPVDKGSHTLKFQHKTNTGTYAAYVIKDYSSIGFDVRGAV